MAPGIREAGLAQRRPGREPRRHGCGRLSMSGGGCAQRRPGREPRRHAAGAGPPGRFPPSLNEGRGVNPGDTRRRSPCTCHVAPLNEGRGVNPGDTRARAQRQYALGPLNEGRGVNPGDTGEASSSARRTSRAQRRPGREPRRHADRQKPSRIGPATAQRRPGREPRRHPHRYIPTHPVHRALNEGRGVNPGDTGRPEIVTSTMTGRSTKAGA